MNTKVIVDAGHGGNVDEKDVNAVIKELHELGEKAYEIGVVTAGGEGVCLK